MRIVCPFTPGGSQDNIARRLGAKLSDYFGQSFVIDNRTGAGGSIAADNVAKSPPDGYSVLLGNIGSHAAGAASLRQAALQCLHRPRDGGWIGTQPNLLCCHPELPARHVAKLIAAAKAEPGKYPVRLARASAPRPSLTMELFKQKTGADLTFISYRGASAAAADVLAGHVPLCIANIDSLMGQVNAGKLKPIATTGAQRSPVAPDTPTFVEAGFPDLVVTSWSLWAVPAGTPAKASRRSSGRAPSGRCKHPT